MAGDGAVTGPPPLPGKLGCFLLLIVLLSSSRTVSSSPWEGIENALESQICTKLMKHIYHGDVVSTSPPDVTGEWTSHRCEVRPGPEFVLRRYRFTNESTFEAHIYYYSDVHCTQPLFSTVARGRLQYVGKSWVVPGANDLDYQLTHVAVMPYTEEMAAILGAKVNRSCQGSFYQHSAWKPYNRYDIFNYVEFHDHRLADYEDDAYVVVDQDCTHAIDFSLHELQLARVEGRRQGHQNGVVKSLLLGDIHTDRKQRTFHRPTTFQEPLFPPQTAGCPVCHSVANSDDYYPPLLDRHHLHPPLRLPGEWFSERCEPRPHGMFLTRHILFSRDDRSWDGHYHHFADPLCRVPLYSIFARGSYVAGIPSPIISDALHYDFKVVELKVTPKDTSIVTTLREAPGKCGVKPKWEIGTEQDVTHTRGCSALQIEVPHVEFELLRLEKEHHRTLLYLGQRPSDGGHPSSSRKRPTSFQPPLVQCGDVTQQISLNFHSREISLAQTALSAGQQWRMSYGSVLMLVLLLPLLFATV